MTRRPSRSRIARAILAEAPGASLLVVLLAALLAGGGAAASAWASAARTDVLQSAVAASPPSQRDLGDATRGVPITNAGSGLDRGMPPEVAAVWGGTFDQLDRFVADADPAAAAILGAPHAVLRFDQAPALPLDPTVQVPDSRIILSADPLLDQLADVVDGALPGPIVEGEPIEIALTEPVADAFGWAIGEVRSAHYSVGDRELVLVGLLAPRDASAGEWVHAAVALQPEEIDNFEQPPTFVGVGYLNAGSIASLEELAPASVFETWLPVDPAAIRADAADDTVAALRRFQSTPHTLPFVTDFGQADADIAFTGTTASIITSTGPLLAGVVAVHTAIASGVALAGAAVLALAVRALVARRRSLLRLLAARGASDGARAGALALGTGALALLGAAPAAAIVAGVAGGPAVIVVLVAASVVAVAAGAAAIDGALVERSGARPDDADRRRGRVRSAVDGGIVLLAIAAAVVVVLTPAGTGSAPPPLVVLLPAFAAAAGCVIALRVVPLLVRAVQRAAHRARGLVSLLGPARAGRDATTGVVPVLALLTAVTIAVLGSGLLATVQNGVDAAASAQVGADVRVDARYLGEDDIDAARALDGIAAVAVVASDPDQTVEFPDGDGRVTVYVVDAAEFAAASTSEVEIPHDGALASQTVSDRLAGDPLELGGAEVPVVGVVPDDGPFGRASAWIVVSPATAAELDIAARPKALLVATDDGRTDAVRAALAARLSAVGIVRSLDEVVAERRGAPAVQALVTGTAIAVVASAVLTVLAAALALTAGAAGRARVFGLLRALGARSRAEYALVLWELLPALAIAVPLGLGIGVLLVPLLARSGDLTVFTGGSVQPAISLGLDTSALVVAALVVVVILGVLLAAALARRSGASRAVRTVDEEG